MIIIFHLGNRRLLYIKSSTLSIFTHSFQRRQGQPTPVLLPGKSHGRRSLEGYSPWGRKELDTTEQLHFHFSLSCIGEGNGNPLQRSCVENPRDEGAWWAAVYGVAQSRTRLKRLSSSSGSVHSFKMILWSRLLGARHTTKDKRKEKKAITPSLKVRPL